MMYSMESARVALAAGQATVEFLAATTGWPIVDGCLIPEPEKWHTDDGNAGLVCEASSGKVAAQNYVYKGERGDINKTVWINVRVWREGLDAGGDSVRVGEDIYKITLMPREPGCVYGEEHDWQSPLDLVGGIKDSPGVYGSGGGVTIREACTRCGCGKLTDTWATDPVDGQQGLRAVSYEPGRYREYITNERLTFNYDGDDTVQ